MNEGYPLWVIILLAIFAAIGTFYGKIKSSLELWIKGKNNFEIHKLSAKKDEINILKERISLLEKKNIKLIKSNTALSTAIIFMIDEYQKSNPENTTVIESVRDLIKQNLVEHAK